MPATTIPPRSEEKYALMEKIRNRLEKAGFDIIERPGIVTPIQGLDLAYAALRKKDDEWQAVAVLDYDKYGHYDYHDAIFEEHGVLAHSFSHIFLYDAPSRGENTHPRRTPDHVTICEEEGDIPSSFDFDRLINLTYVDQMRAIKAMKSDFGRVDVAQLGRGDLDQIATVRTSPEPNPFMLGYFVRSNRDSFTLELDVKVNDGPHRSLDNFEKFEKRFTARFDSLAEDVFVKIVQAGDQKLYDSVKRVKNDSQDIYRTFIDTSLQSWSTKLILEAELDEPTAECMSEARKKLKPLEDIFSSDPETAQSSTNDAEGDQSGDDDDD